MPRLVVRWLVALAMFAGVANAQPSPEVTHEFSAGVDAFRLGKYDEARAHLEKAKLLDPKLAGPNRFLAAVAHAQGRWAECIAAARTALALNPVSQELADTRKLHDDCRTAAGRTPYRAELGDSAAIAVTSNVAGATVKIGGLTYGGTPIAPRVITAGKLAIDIDKAGWKPLHLEIDALPGIVTDVVAELEPDPSAQHIDIVKRVDPKTNGWLVIPPSSGRLRVDGREISSTKDPIALEPGTHVVELDVERSDPWRRRVRINAGQKTPVAPVFVATSERESKERTGYLLLGGGAAIGAFGFAAFLISTHAADDAREILRVESKRTTPIDESLEPLHTRADFEDARSRATRWATISNLAYGAALVTAGVGAYYIYRGGKARSDVPPPYAIAPLTGGGAMVTKAVTW
jgi:hypothetical protein